MIKTLREVVLAAKNQRRVIAVAAAEDPELLEALAEAERHGMAQFLLFGDAVRIRELLEVNHIQLKKYEIHDAATLEDAAEDAAKAVGEGKADILMKGKVDTKILLKALLRKEHGLRKNPLLSHVMVYEMKSYPKLLLLTDGGMVMAPTLEEKVELIRNAKDLQKVLGLQPMKVAVLSAVEKVNPNLPSSVDAAELEKRTGTEGFEDMHIQGPFALDNAVSKEAAALKGIQGEVAGDADLLLVPTLEAGNLLGKSFTYMAGAESAGIVLGARCPVIVTSRADNRQAKLNSIALAVLLAEPEGEEALSADTHE